MTHRHLVSGPGAIAGQERLTDVGVGQRPRLNGMPQRRKQPRGPLGRGHTLGMGRDRRVECGGQQADT
jgi:hypothetical protein